MIGAEIGYGAQSAEVIATSKGSKGNRNRIEETKEEPSAKAGQRRNAIAG